MLAMARSHAKHIKESVAAVLIDAENAIGGNILGTYTNKSKKTIPAACVGSRPTGWSCSGLELLVGLLPITGESQHRNTAKGVDGHVLVTGLWQIDLRQHHLDADTNGNDVDYEEQEQKRDIVIDMAWDRLIAFTECKFEFLPKAEISTSYSQLSFLIPFSLSGKAIASTPHQ
jgi:hypothetical protein